MPRTIPVAAACVSLKISCAGGKSFQLRFKTNGGRGDVPLCFLQLLTKTRSLTQAGALVVMLKESDLMSHTVIGVEAFGCFCQQAERCDWAGWCSERMGSCPWEHDVKGEVSSWK